MHSGMNLKGSEVRLDHAHLNGSSKSITADKVCKSHWETKIVLCLPICFSVDNFTINIWFGAGTNARTHTRSRTRIYSSVKKIHKNIYKYCKEDVSWMALFSLWLADIGSKIIDYIEALYTPCITTVHNVMFHYVECRRSCAVCGTDIPTSFSLIHILLLNPDDR